MKRKNNDAKAAAEYGAMVFRQDLECAPSLDRAVLVPDSEGLVKAIANAIQEAQKNGIEHNAVLINPKLVRVPEFYVKTPIGINRVPAMICGLEVFDGSEILPPGYSFAVTKIPEMREEVAAKAKEEIVHEILDMLDELKPRFDQIDYAMGWSAAITAMRYIISTKYKQGENNDTEMHQE